MTDITEPRKMLTGLREQYGHDSPIGRRASTAIEQLQNLQKPEFAWRAPALRSSLAATLREIQRLQAGEPAGKVCERREEA
jgi:hypothetical protein